MSRYNNTLTGSHDLWPSDLDRLMDAVRAPVVLRPTGPGTMSCPMSPQQYAEMQEIMDKKSPQGWTDADLLVEFQYRVAMGE